MAEEDAPIYHSGQIVPQKGWYEAIGSEYVINHRVARRFTCVLKQYEMFPNYDGRAISWRALTDMPEDFVAACWTKTVDLANVQATPHRSRRQHHLG
jgi:hypothetical protein